jgi:solute carrier family 35 protein F1/2
MDWARLRVLLHGQGISALIAGTGIFATLLSSTSPSANFPTLMNLCNYALMSTFLFWLTKRRRDQDPNPRDPRDPRGQDGAKGKREYSNNVAVFTPISEVDEIGSSSTGRQVQHQGQLQHEYYNYCEDDEDAADAAFEARYLTDRSNPQQRRNLYGYYLLAAILDLEANYLVISAYNYTTITSVMLLDCFTIPSSMVLSYYFLGYQYNLSHFVGAILCLVGLGLIVLSDILVAEDTSSATTAARDPVVGDILCLCGSFLYASSNVLQEYLVKRYGRVRYIGHVGAFGMLLASIQFAAADLPRLVKVGARLPLVSVGYMVGFVGCLFGMCVSTSMFLHIGDATLFNLSLLTSDVYAVLFSYLMYHRLVHWLYFLAFACVAMGLVVYHRTDAPDALVIEGSLQHQHKHRQPVDAEGDPEPCESS